MVNRIDPRPGELLLDPACGTGGFLTCALRHMRDRYVKTTKDEQTIMRELLFFTGAERLLHLSVFNEPFPDVVLFDSTVNRELSMCGAGSVLPYRPTLRWLFVRPSQLVLEDYASSSPRAARHALTARVPSTASSPPRRSEQTERGPSEREPRSYDQDHAT